ncbi:hypothetical protein, partial [Brucella sp. 10RB9210]|uniref:hypothetical protein n=1 Tax=Brucella sp. 10RB9210 TaxID=1844037 RepID=UPI0019D61179
IHHVAPRHDENVPSWHLIASMAEQRTFGFAPKDESFLLKQNHKLIHLRIPTFNSAHFEHPKGLFPIIIS